MDHSDLFLMPVWRTLGRASWVVKGRALPKTLAVASLVLVAILVLTFVKKDFYLKANGSLQPVEKRDVFVDVGGTVTDVFVEDLKPSVPTSNWCSWKIRMLRSSWSTSTASSRLHANKWSRPKTLWPDRPI